MERGQDQRRLARDLGQRDIDELRPGPAQADGGEGDDSAEGRRRADSEARLIVGPGDRVEDVDDDGDGCEADHDRDEREVAEPGVRGDGEGEMAEHRGHRDQRGDEDQPAEGAPHQHEDPQPADRVQRDPFRGQGQPEEDTDDRHRDPERASPAPRAGPDRREHGVGGHDPQPDVRVVHPDPGLDEEHPVGDGEDADEDADLSAPEQDPGQEVDEARHQGPGDDTGQAPGERVLADLDAGDRSVVAEREDLLAVGAGIGLGDVDRPGRRLERQAGIGEDGVGMRLDHVDRPAGAVRRRAEDMDHLGGLVPGDPGADDRERQRPLEGGAVLRRIAADGDDRDPSRIAPRRSRRS